MSAKITNSSKKRQSYFFTTLNIPKDSCEFHKLITNWLDYCRADGLSAATIHEYSDKISRFYWWYTVHTGYSQSLGQHPKFVTVKEAREFAAYLREPLQTRWGVKVPDNKQELSAATIAGYGRSVKVFFSWLEREEYIQQSPFNKSVKFTTRTKDTVIKNVSSDKLALIFAALTNPTQLSTFAGVRDLAMISLLLDSGMRRGELLSLELSDVDIPKLRCTITGKTGKRLAYFSEKCKGVLLDYLKLRKEINNTNWLWLTIEGERLGDYSFGSIVRRLQIRSGTKFHIHQLRHTFALLMSNKVSVFELRDLMGHSSIATTMIYVQQNPDRLGATHRLNSPLNNMADLPGLKRRGRPRKLK